MKRHQEIQQIHEWVADWRGTSVEDSPFSREDIRHICRGPMRDVFVSFLLSHVRSDEQIKVIRSNIYWNDVSTKDPSLQQGQLPPNHYEQEMKETKKKLDELNENKLKKVQECCLTAKTIDESKTILVSNLKDLVSNFEKTESRAQLVKNRVTSTGVLLHELHTANAKPAHVPSHSSERITPVTDGEVSNADSLPANQQSENSHQPQLKSLYNNAVDLFDLHLLPSPNANTSQLNMSSEIQALMATVSAQTSDLAQSGVSPASIERWARFDQDASINQVKSVCNKFSNVMNPLEELQNETEALYTKLMTAHLELHLSNKPLKSKVLGLEISNREKIEDAVLQCTKALPEDLLLQIRKEEISKGLAKCRELIRMFKDLEQRSQAQSNDDSDVLLSDLCGNFADMEEQRRNSGPIERSMRQSIGSIDGNGSFNLAKQETLEDLTCGLLKSFPHSHSQLENTLEHCKTLILEKFPKILSNDKTEAASKLKDISIPSTDLTISRRQAVDGIKVPKQFLPNYDLMMTDSVVNAQDDELLGEIFRMRNEIESKRVQNEKIIRERLSGLKEDN